MGYRPIVNLKLLKMLWFNRPRYRKLLKGKRKEVKRKRRRRSLRKRVKIPDYYLDSMGLKYEEGDSARYVQKPSNFHLKFSFFVFRKVLYLWPTYFHVYTHDCAYCA